MTKTDYAHHTTHIAYQVEVRSASDRVVMLWGKPYGTGWTAYTMLEDKIFDGGTYREYHLHGYWSYQEAMAIAWLILSRSWSLVETDGFGLNVRLVAYDITYSCEAKMKLAHAQIEGVAP